MNLLFGWLVISLFSNVGRLKGFISNLIKAAHFIMEWGGKFLNFLSSPISKFFVSLFLIFAYFFSALSISEVFEDYIHDEKIKNAANKTLNIFAILLPLFTIIVLFNLTL